MSVSVYVRERAGDHRSVFLGSHTSGIIFGLLLNVSGGLVKVQADLSTSEVPSVHCDSALQWADVSYLSQVQLG